MQVDGQDHSEDSGRKTHGGTLGAKPRRGCYLSVRVQWRGFRIASADVQDARSRSHGPAAYGLILRHGDRALVGPDSACQQGLRVRAVCFYHAMASLPFL